MPIFAVGVNKMQLMHQLDLLTSLMSHFRIFSVTLHLFTAHWGVMALIFMLKERFYLPQSRCLKPAFLSRVCFTRLHTKSPLFLFPASRGNFSEAERFVICVLDYVFLIYCLLNHEYCVNCCTTDCLSFKLSSGERTDGHSTSCFTPANSPTTP